MTSSTAVVWFRRDLRLGDQPTLLAAADRADRALALFVLDDALLSPSGRPRRAFLYGCLRALDERLGGRLLVVRGDPADVVPRVAAAVGAGSVHVAADFGPYGRRRDAAVERALGELDVERGPSKARGRSGAGGGRGASGISGGSAADGRSAGRGSAGVELVRTGSPYAVAPGRVLTGDGEGYRVFTPFHRAWQRHGWRAPADTGPSTVDWMDPADEDGGPRAVRIPDEGAPASMELPSPGEEAALRAWRTFRRDHLAGYAEDRDRPDLPGTSRMSPYLRWGCVHPRTLLADLSGPGSETFGKELAWREFHADVLWHRPNTARSNYDRRFDAMEFDGSDAHFEAWCAGRTGFPIVDAGMRQLLAEGWMHNRVRMIVASFLVKDLHLPWWLGASHFMHHLVDGDLASNQHNWQWVAGTGTDAAPYFRVFNPTAQGERFDPSGDYVRRYVPELRGVPGKAVHTLRDARPSGYPHPIVDHATERELTLTRYSALPSRS